MVGEPVGYPSSFSTSRCAGLLLAILLAPGCTGRDSGPQPLTAVVPLHLEDHLDAAIIEGSEVPEDIPEAVEWRFDEPQPGWKPAYGYEFSQKLVELVRTGDALQVILEEKRGGPRNSDSLLRWDPDQGEGVWNATEETELSC